MSIQLAIAMLEQVSKNVSLLIFCLSFSAQAEATEHAPDRVSPSSSMDCVSSVDEGVGSKGDMDDLSALGNSPSVYVSS